jgi:hypothetical protein
VPQIDELRRDKPLIPSIADLPVAQLRPVDPGYGAQNIAGSSPRAAFNYSAGSLQQISVITR